MIFDSQGRPKDSGASDYADSARLAGLMALFNHPQMNGRLVLPQYVDETGMAVRYPDVDPYQKLDEQSSNNPKNVTRDQIICLAAGLWRTDQIGACLNMLERAERDGCRAQNTEADVPGSTKTFPNGADLLTPSHMNHLRLCSYKKTTKLGTAWLIADIVFSSMFSPMAEPNQLIAMCVVAGPKYVKLLKRCNPCLYDAIRDYWGGWRDEREFASFIIGKLEAYG